MFKFSSPKKKSKEKMICEVIFLNILEEFLNILFPRIKSSK
jgi:hypothetical protein